MNDYSTNKEEQKNFIEDYTEYEDCIVINLANGKRYTIPNTEANKQIIDNKMKEQVQGAEKYRRKRIIGSYIYRFLLALGIVMGAIGIPATIANPGTQKIIMIISSVITLIGAGEAIEELALLKDYEKNKFFVDNEAKIKEGLEDTNVLNNTRKKVQKIVAEEELSLNNLDRVRESDLRSVVEGLQREKTFGFEKFSEEEYYPSEQKQDEDKIITMPKKPKTRIRKK